MSHSDSLFLSVGFADGTEQTVTVTAPGRGLRLAVGSLNSRSSVWRATARRNDVYITATGLGQSMKLSLHKSGIWRLAFHSEQHAAQAGAAGTPEFNGDPRLVDRWEQPEGAAGWMHALTVWVPHGHLTPLPEAIEDPYRPVTWLPEPAEGEMVGLHFAVVRPDEGAIDPGDMSVVAGFQLPDNRALIALTSRRPIEAARARWLRDMAVIGLMVPQGNHIKDYGDPLRVGVFTGSGEDGTRAVYDLRAPQRDVLEKVISDGQLSVSRTYQPPADGQ